MALEEVFSKAGFSDGEARVYSAILGEDGATLQAVHERTGIERRNVYDIINKLISKGLVTYFTENRHKTYRATHPKNIIAHIEEDEKRLAEKKAALEGEMARLVSAYNSSKPEFDVRIYRGKEGVKSLFNEMLDYPDHYFIGGNWGCIKCVGRAWWGGWEQKRVEKKIWWHDIITTKLIEQNPAPKKYYESCVLPPEFNSPNVILIFGSRVANIYWGEPAFAFVLENKEIARNYLGYFKYLWKTLGK